MMKKISIFSVITMLMTLFIWTFSVQTHAYSYDKGFEPLNEKTEYVDIIMPNLQAVKGYCNTVDYGKFSFNQSRYNNVNIKRTRYINDDTNNILVTEYYPNLNGDILFKLSYNNKEVIQFRMTKYNSKCFFEKQGLLDFNDYTRPEYINCDHVKLSEPITEIISSNTINIDFSNYPDYEDVIVFKKFEVTNVEEKTLELVDIPNPDDLLKTPIVLENGLKLEENNNFFYGGNYELDTNLYLAPGTYYYKLANEYENKSYAYVYKIIINEAIKKFPSFQTSIKRQIKSEEIDELIESYGIEEYSYDATKYFNNFDEIGTYIINVSYSIRGKDFEATLQIKVTDIGDQKFKLKDESQLTISYENPISEASFEDNIDFSYLYLADYNVDYSRYVNHYDEVGSYLIHIMAHDIHNNTYIQSYYINVIDNVIPNVTISDDIKTDYSYKDDITIDDIIKYLNIEDKSNYDITYDKKLDNSVGSHIINFKITDEYNNEAICPITINIIDDIAPKLIINDINTTTDLLLDENTIKAQIYAIDEVDGRINTDNITLNDINGYKYNCDIPGTYRFEAIAKDNYGNEGHGFFNIVISENNEEITETINIITLERGTRLNKDEIINYLIARGYLEADKDYLVSSNYFDDEYLESDKYDVEVACGNDKYNYQIVIKEPDVIYEVSEKKEEREDNKTTIIIVVVIISVLLGASGILIFIIYKKRH